ncbi:hypothetical protein [Roseomonas genomospecies 6]|nr:hypothetical protein [Roseomonas genomospecies 6]
MENDEYLTHCEGLNNFARKGDLFQILAKKWRTFSLAAPASAALNVRKVASIPEWKAAMSTEDLRVQTAINSLDDVEAMLEEVCADRRIPAPQVNALLERLAAIADLVDTGSSAPEERPDPPITWLH